MSRFRTIFTTILALAIAITAGAAAKNAPKDTLRILAIGNSFTVDASQDLYGVFEAQGTPAIIGFITKGSSSIEDHLRWAVSDSAAFVFRVDRDGKSESRNGATLSQALSEQRWDIVTFQQQSQKAMDFNTVDPYLKPLIKYVRKRTPKDVKLFWHSNWAYENESTHTNVLQQFGYMSQGMYETITDASKRLCDKYGLSVIPCGTTIQNLRTGFTMNNTTRDGFHMSITMGRYAVACTWYEALTGNTTEGCSYAPRTMPNYIRRAQAQKAAHLANANPWEVTRMNEGRSSYGSIEAGPRNTDEALVPEYTLPDPLVMQDGTPVTTPEQWNDKRREELLELFRSEEYGRSPERFAGQHYKVIEEDDNVFGGLATRRQVAIYFTESDDDYMVLLMYIPNRAKGPVPAFLYINLSGNEAMHTDPGILPPDENQRKRYGVYGIPAKGQKQERLPVEMILDRGYAYATFFKSDLDPDRDDGFLNGVHKYTAQGMKYHDDDAWGSISAWAWGMSRALDYLETDPDVDGAKVAAIGHSRGGKTALWAAAQDTRFAMAVSSCSGCSGAALARRRFGETVRAIQVNYPHWFCTNYIKYMDNEDAMPMDQHELISLIAPRPVYVASASLDSGADPRGEFLGLMGADPVYKLLGRGGMPEGAQFPAPREEIAGDCMAYHLREGMHNIMAFDWMYYLDFADKYLK